MFSSDSERIREATEKYNKYVATQTDIIIPQAIITIEENNDDYTNVFMEISYKNNNYHFESIKPKHVEDYHAYLNSQPLVRARYANGDTLSFEGSEKRTLQLSNRFKPNPSDGLYLYSGFVVTDQDNEEFLGVANLGGSGKNDGHAEMAYLNRLDSWSNATPEIIREYAIPKKCKLNKSYQGIATAEVSALLQYSAKLKQAGYKIQDQVLVSVDAKARLDNPGSWKACAKSGMELVEIGINSNYGSELRYQLAKRL